MTRLVLASALYADFHPLNKFFPDAEMVTVHDPSDLPEGPGILILHGGSDIHPSLYSRKSDGSHVNIEPSKRDHLEVALYQRAVALGYYIFGICRGAQLICAMHGGILIQDVHGHTFGDHPIEVSNGYKMLTNSIHHQMMYPWKVDGMELLAWSSPPRSSRYRGLNEEELGFLEELDNHHEPEIVWFPRDKALAIQGHPEGLAANAQLNLYIYSELSRRMGV